MTRTLSALCLLWFALASPAGAFAYGYASPASLVSSLGLPNGASITNHNDSLGRLDYTGLRDHWGHVLDGYAYTHDPLGLRTNIARHLGMTTNNVAVRYDNIGQVISWNATESSGAARQNEQMAWAYDPANNLRFRTNGALVQTFSVDAGNQLTNVSRSGNLTVSGNTPAPATSVTVNGHAASIYSDQTFAVTNLVLANGQNSFTNSASNTYGSNSTSTLTMALSNSVTLQFDSNGSLTNDGTRVFVYDSENRLVTNYVSGSWKSELVYDGLGRRRVERDYGWSSGWSKTNELHFIYDGLLLVQVRDGYNSVLWTYTRGIDMGGGLVDAGGIGGLLGRTDTNGSTFYHADGSGNVTGLIDNYQFMQARYEYSPFGKLVGKWGALADANEMQFSSMPIHRQSGIVGYPGRGYEPTLQRWIQQDPSGEAGGINLYQFSLNNPLSFIDPDGAAPQVVGLSFNINGGPSNVRYANQQFGQDYGPGLHGPMGPGGQIAVLTGAGMVPGVGEAMDASVLADPDSRWWEKGLAATSLGLNALTEGFLPNAGPFLKSGKTLCKDKKLYRGVPGNGTEKAVLAQQGIAKPRGNALDPISLEKHVKGEDVSAGVTSWTTDRNVAAQRFAGPGGTVIEVDAGKVADRIVPRPNVSKYGSEQEVLLKGIIQGTPTKP